MSNICSDRYNTNRFVQKHQILSSRHFTASWGNANTSWTFHWGDHWRFLLLLNSTGRKNSLDGRFSKKWYPKQTSFVYRIFLNSSKVKKNTSYPTGTYTWTDPIYLKRRLDLMLHHLPDTLRTNHEDWRRNVATNNKMIHHGTDPSSRQEVWWWQKELVRRGVSTTGCEISRGDL